MGLGRTLQAAKRQHDARRARDPERGALVAKCAPGWFSMRLYANGDIEYSWGNESGNVVGATARVEKSGSGRIARETGQPYITIEGPRVSIARKLTNSGSAVEQAREFAGKVNQLSQQLAPTQAPSSSGAPRQARSSSGASPQPVADIPDQIRKLAELRDQGILSAEEFDAKKADLLNRL